MVNIKDSEVSLAHLLKYPQFCEPQMFPYRKKNENKGGKGEEGKTILIHTSLYTSQPMLLREGLAKPEYWNRQIFIYLYIYLCIYL